jgi:hypothetical protein
MNEKEQKRRESDRKYIKYKMKMIQKAKKQGNNAAASRHSTELIQYLGLERDSETPIEGMLDPLE